MVAAHSNVHHFVTCILFFKSLDYEYFTQIWEDVTKTPASILCENMKCIYIFCIKHDCVLSYYQWQCNGEMFDNHYIIYFKYMSSCDTDFPVKSQSVSPFKTRINSLTKITFQNAFLYFSPFFLTNSTTGCKNPIHCFSILITLLMEKEHLFKICMGVFCFTHLFHEEKKQGTCIVKLLASLL